MPWERFGAGFRGALSRGELDKAWSILSRAAENFLADRAGSKAGGARVAGPATAVRTAFVGKADRDGGAASPHVMIMLRMVRVLEQAVVGWPDGMGSLPYQVVLLLRAAGELA